MKQTQFKLTLPDELRAQLDEASIGSGRSVAEEIRWRVALSFEMDLEVDLEAARALRYFCRWLMK